MGQVGPADRGRKPDIVQGIEFIPFARGLGRPHARRRRHPALAAVEARDPDIVILDAMLPNRSGFEILQELRALPRFADLPVLMLTARGQKQDARWPERYGASRFMTKKPFSNAEVLASVRE